MLLMFRKTFNKNNSSRKGVWRINKIDEKTLKKTFEMISMKPMKKLHLILTDDILN